MVLLMIWAVLAKIVWWVFVFMIVLMAIGTVLILWIAFTGYMLARYDDLHRGPQ